MLAKNVNNLAKSIEQLAKIIKRLAKNWASNSLAKLTKG